MENNIGAISALRGYRVQFLYTLNRILFHSKDETTFEPEGKFEDLDIYDNKNQILEVIQIKALSEKLTLSNILNNKPNSFIRRALRSHLNKVKPKIKLVSFGEVNEDILELHRSKFGKTLRNKLKSQGLKDSDIETLEQSFTYEKISEDIIKEKLSNKLKELKIFTDTNLSLDLLIYWVYKIAENQQKISSNLIQGRLLSIGQFESDRINFNNSFGTLIRPFNENLKNVDIGKLRSDFYQGVSATYSHIMAGVDILREEKLISLNEKLTKSNIVFVHGASGQGKTTIALRYLRDFTNEQTSYTLTLPPDYRKVYEVISALESISKGIDIPITLYIDVIPGTKEWISLIQELSSKTLFKFIVTIREEDWNSISIGDKFSFEELELDLKKEEAEEIYNSLNKYKTDLRFIDFDNAWNNFGGTGPLLEFVYLITQKKSLPEKIKSQINAIQDKNSELSRQKLKLLRFVALADSFGATVKYKEVVSHLKLDTIDRLIELLEKEYLLKLSNEKTYITGLHPVRSEIITGILFDNEIHLKADYILESLPFVDDRTLLVYLRHGFKKANLRVDSLLEKLKKEQPISWLAYYAILKSLLWKGVYDYKETNKEILNTVYSEYQSGWITIIQFDISNTIQTPLYELIEGFTDDQKIFARKQNSSLTDKESIFIPCKDFFNNLQEISISATTEDDVKALSFLMFWMNELKANISISLESTIGPLKPGSISLTTLALLVGSLKSQHGIAGKSKLTELSQEFEKRFYVEHNVMFLEENEQNVKCVYFFDFFKILSSKSASDDPLHEASLKIVNLLRSAYPNKEVYECSGYGHKSKLNTVDYDPTLKQIPRKNLPIKELVEINSTFINLYNFEVRPETWEDYATSVFKRRVDMVNVLQELNSAFAAYHKQKNALPLLEFIQNYIKKHDGLMKQKVSFFPKNIIDEWGIISETSDRSSLKALAEGGKKEETKLSLSLKSFEPYRSVYQDIDNALSIFIEQSCVIIDNKIKRILAKNPKDLDYLERISIVGNLRNVASSIENYQASFRKYFGKFVNHKELIEIEKRELEGIFSVYFLYRHFLYSTSFLNGNVLKDSLRHFQETKDTFERHITKNLNKSAKTANFTIKINFKNNQVFILIDSASPIDSLNNLGLVYNELFNAANKPDATSIKYAIIETFFKSFFIIPTVFGRSFNTQLYEFSAPQILEKSFEELTTLELFPKEIWSEIQKEYSLVPWKLDEIEPLQKLVENINTTYYLVQHFTQFFEFADRQMNETADKHIQEYFKKITSSLQENLQSALDIYVNHNLLVFEDKYDFITKDEKQEMLAYFEENRKYFYPTDDSYEDTDNGKPIATSEMDVWLPRLEKLVGACSFIYMYLSGKIITKNQLPNLSDHSKEIG